MSQEGGCNVAGGRRQLMFPLVTSCMWVGSHSHIIPVTQEHPQIPSCVAVPANFLEFCYKFQY